MTLDAGGTFLKFSAIQGGKLLFHLSGIPSEADKLDHCLHNIIQGFEQVRQRLSTPPVAISFAFSGPTDYRRGIVRDLPNLPGFRGGVALGPMLEEHFGVPVFINNDGDLFAYGEALEGFLPYVNGLLEQAGSARRYRNLMGVTLGTGFGGGLVSNGHLFLGDNASGMEIGLLRNKLEPSRNVEQSASINGLRRFFAQAAGIPFEDAPDPKVIAGIALGESAGNAAAAREAYRCLGETVGEAIAQAMTLVDGLVVIGGGVSGAAPLFMPALVDAMNGIFPTPDGPRRRLFSQAFNLEDPIQLESFLADHSQQIPIPNSSKTVRYDPTTRVAAGLTRLGTSQSVAIGAYAYAIDALSL